jgi:hypothetical protein
MTKGTGPHKHKFREYLFKKQGGKCHWCGQQMSLSARVKSGGPARNFATFEHLERVQDGGKTNSTNVVLAHRKCNTKRNHEYQLMVPHHHRQRVITSDVHSGK